MSSCHNAFAKIQRRKEITKKNGRKNLFPVLIPPSGGGVASGVDLESIKTFSFVEKKIFMEIFDPKGEFNCVDLCHDAAKHADMMALAAPSVADHGVSSDLFQIK